jgi:hypothetical protein
LHAAEPRFYVSRTVALLLRNLLEREVDTLPFIYVYSLRKVSTHWWEKVELYILVVRLLKIDLSLDLMREEKVLRAGH